MLCSGHIGRVLGLGRHEDAAAGRGQMNVTVVPGHGHVNADAFQGNL